MRFLHPRLPGLLLAIAGVLTAGPAHSQAPKPQTGQKYALLVGVRQYNPNELRELPYSEPDVVELARLLKDAGYRQVVTLTQTTGATNSRLLPLAENIRTTLKGMLADREPEDSVVLAFAGHGVQFSGSAENYFCPMDAKLADRATLISFADVYRQLEACAAGVRIMLVDACRNDPQSDNSRARSVVKLESVTRPQQHRPPGGVAALFSCSEGEKSFEHAELKHGVFFHYVIEGLKGKADLDKDGAVDVEELAQYTKRSVPDFVKEQYGFDVRQMPVLRGEISGLATIVGSLPLEPAPNGTPPLGKPAPGTPARPEKDRRSRIGVAFSPLSPAAAQTIGIDPMMKGALVVGVLPGGPAEKAGLKVNDVVTSFNQQQFIDLASFKERLAASAIGKPLTLTYHRNGQEQSVVIIPVPTEEAIFDQEKTSPAKPPEDEGRRRVMPGGPQTALHEFGLEVQPMTAELARDAGLKESDGLLIRAVREGSPASAQGLAPGLAITQMVKDKNLQSVKQVSDLEALAEKSEDLTLYVKSSKIPGAFVTLKKARPGPPPR